MAQELTVEEIYNFDTAGWLHLPSVLSAPELVAAASSLSEEPEQLAEQLLEHPALKLRVEQLVASPNRADADRVVREDGSFTLQMNGPAAELDVTQEELLTGGPVGEDGVLDTSRTYFNQAGHRYVHGLVVIWALAPGESDGGYEVVTASHKSTMPVPAHMRTVVGGGALRDLGLLQQPPLQAGDVLLVSSATLQGARHPSGGTGPRLLRAEFLSRRARPTVTREPHAPEREADWMAELDPIQRVVMGLEPQKRTAGDGLPTLRARDGTAWLEEDAEGTRPLHHPTALVPNLELSERQREEFFLWEMGGYLVVRGLMDADWIAAANAAVNWAMEQPEDSPHHIPHGRSGNFLRPLSLPHPHCDPFRRMVAHPAVLERMEWMLGSGFVHCENQLLLKQASLPPLSDDYAHPAHATHRRLSTGTTCQQGRRRSTHPRWADGPRNGLPLYSLLRWEVLR